MAVADPVWTLPAAVTLHLASAVAAVALGPVALGARKGSRLHRAAGTVWVAAMLAAAVSSLFIRDFGRPNLAGYTVIHLLTLATFAGLGRAMWAIVHGQVAVHRQAMRSLYVGACLVAGAFTLMPDRLLGGLLWRDTLGWL